MERTHRRLRQWVVVSLALVGLMGAWQIPAAQAQTTLFAYSAKFVCGPRTSDLQVVRGQYATVVNIHNPHFQEVNFRKKAVIALSQREPRGPISNFVGETLKADEALGVDCRDIRALFAPTILPALIEGFVVLYSPVQLDVVAVYTARHRAGVAPDDSNEVETMDVEEVTPKRITP
jgi:hypothetical protein